MQLVEDQVTYDRNNPFPAKLKEKRRLSHPDSEKETVHFVVDIAGSGLTYSCGDSLGVYPKNNPKNVESLITELGFDCQEPVLLPKQEATISLYDALSSHLSLAAPSKKFLSFLNEKVSSASEREKLESLLNTDAQDELADYLANREYIDLAEEYPSAKFTAQEYVTHLKRLVPRLYSIASSPLLYPNEIHLTIAVLRYKTNNRDRLGVASTYLADRVLLDEANTPVFIAKSHFGLPEDLGRDIIMVGPGTGIAPFRSFIQEYIHRGGSGRTWLFFGGRKRSQDFLYQEEWEDYINNNHLHRLDLAFSRDQDYKIYVQHKMQESAKELWEWINMGAYFYVCGDKNHMAKDVDETLHKIIEEQGGMTAEEAKDYVKEMKKTKRYQRDVY